jgi:hypothetical protein
MNTLYASLSNLLIFIRSFLLEIRGIVILSLQKILNFLDIVFKTSLIAVYVISL